MDLSSFSDLSDHKKYIIASVVNVKKGFRKVGRIEVSSEKALEEWNDICSLMRLETFKDIEEDNGDLVLFYSKNRDDLLNAVDLHKNDEDYIDPNKTLAHFYGYPNCCADHFSKNLEVVINHGDRELKFRTLKKESPGVYNVKMNNFWGAEFVQHHVCSFKCKKSLEIAKKKAKILKAVDRDFYKKLIDMRNVCIIYNEQNKKKIVIEDGFRVASQGVILDKDGFRVASQGATLDKEKAKDFLNGQLRFKFKSDKFRVYVFK